MLQRSKPARPARRTTVKDGAAASKTPAGPETPEPSVTSVPDADEAPMAEATAPVPLAPAEAAPVALEAREDLAAPEIASPGVVPAEAQVSSGPTVPAKDADQPLVVQGGMNVPASAASAAVPATISPWTTAQTAQNMMENTMQQANKAAETMMKAAEEAAEFGRGNVEAFTKATQIYVAGMQDLGKQTFAMVQGLTDHAIEGAKALSGVKSLHEAAQIQSNFARAALEKSVTETAKLGEQALKLTEQAVAPLTARFTVATEKLARAPIAA